MNQYWWGNINKMAKSLPRMPSCLKYNPGKLVHSALGHFKLPSGQFEVWQVDLIQLLLSNGYKYV